MPRLHDCIKAHTTVGDKAAQPGETVARARAALAEHGENLLAGVERIDSGRLGIPVYISRYGQRALELTPSRKQMGKGATPEQAEASALMELIERYSLFAFFANRHNFAPMRWSEAERAHPGRIMPAADVARATGEEHLAPETVSKIMDLHEWRFCNALRLHDETELLVPIDYFKMLNEYNGGCAGNTLEECLLQGACEVVERHVCAVVDRERPELPTIDLNSVRSGEDEILRGLLAAFEDNGITVILKDFSLGLPAPTVGALAHDTGTFPGLSEIVFTAGTASTPAKAAIRALTEVAQLGGDFHTGSNYEASGLPKFTAPEEYAWLNRGPSVPLESLPDMSHENIRTELLRLAEGAQSKGYPIYAVETTNPEIGMPTAYCFAPGFLFRERTPAAKLGMFVGRRLAEEAEFEEAVKGLKVIAEVYPDAYFIPFYEGVLFQRDEDHQLAALKFERAMELAPDAEERSMAAFYAGFARTRLEQWSAAVPYLDAAVADSPEVKEYYNLRGVAHFKQGNFEPAAADFRAALDLDSGSACDLANLGICHKMMDEREPAVDYLQHALLLDPGLDFAQKHLDELLATRGS
jgi:ribosomal protein S12 methylthiotransferase accessory factor